MILDRKPLTLLEVKEILKDIPESEKKTQMEQYLKKFLKTKPEQAKKIREETGKLDLLKLKEEHLVKLIDLMPEDASDLNKIFTDISLTEDETNKILEIIKSNK
jgi:DNA-directed RNA polymerase subunit F